jgi:hypothetical protein
MISIGLHWGQRSPQVGHISRDEQTYWGASDGATLSARRGNHES